MPDDRKPGFWLDAGIHANEIQGTEVALYTAWFLLESFGRNEKITELLRDRVFYIMPMLSPDSRDAHMHTPQSTHTPRGGQVPFDDDRDGEADEDGWDDLDGDGNITLMRVADPNGRYVPHPRFPEWMVPAEPVKRYPSGTWIPAMAPSSPVPSLLHSIPSRIRATFAACSASAGDAAVLSALSWPGDGETMTSASER